MSSAEREQAVFALHQTRGNSSLLKAELVQDREMPADPRAFFQEPRKQHTPVAVRAGEIRRGHLVELELGTNPLVVVGEQLQRWAELDGVPPELDQSGSKVLFVVSFRQACMKWKGIKR